jgi:hypothetical protein
MKLFKVVLAVAVFGSILSMMATAKPQYATKEHKKCVDCHVGSPTSKKFTAMGQYYKDHDHSLVGYKAPGPKS